jgi:hypothetical protein
MSDDNVVQFIPASKFNEKEHKEIQREYQDDVPYSEEAQVGQKLTQIAVSGNGVSRISVPRTLDRNYIKNGFMDAFELVGGVPRLAHWADQNYGEFIKLYSRMLPSAMQQQLEHSGEIIVKHVLPRGPLDE